MSSHSLFSRLFVCLFVCSLVWLVLFLYFLGWKSVGLSSASSEKGPIGSERGDLRGLGHLHGYCCGELPLLWTKWPFTNSKMLIIRALVGSVCISFKLSQLTNCLMSRTISNRGANYQQFTACDPQAYTCALLKTSLANRLIASVYVVSLSPFKPSLTLLFSLSVCFKKKRCTNRGSS